MLFAFAALLLHFGSGLSAIPAAAAAAATAGKPAPAPAIADLPSAPLPSNSTSSSAPPAPSSSEASLASSPTRTSHDVAPLLRAAALDSKNTQSLSSIRVPDAQPVKQDFINVETPVSRRKWLALAILDHSAATFDAYSTRQAIEAGAQERDPFMKPFANSGGIYAAIQIAPVVLDFAGRRMQRSQFGVFRHTWWLPQSVGAGLYLFSGVHNLHVANER